jgi:DNA polymerase III delta prime subunit
MHAYILIGQNEKTTQSLLDKTISSFHVAPYDIHTVTREEEKTEITIAQIRELTRALSFPPRASEYVLGIIVNAHLLNTQAQNALLKTLEEPPKSAKILLTTTILDALLPTILSRCQLIYATPDTQTEQTTLTWNDLLQIRNKRPVEQICDIEKYETTRDEALVFVNSALLLLHTQLRLPENNKINAIEWAKFAEKLLIARLQIIQNVNPKLALDNAFL